VIAYDAIVLNHGTGIDDAIDADSHSCVDNCAGHHDCSNTD